MIDEPQVVPVSPGPALVRLAQVKGALQRHANIASVLPDDTLQRLENERANLLAALESNEPKATEAALRATQDCLGRIYETMSQPGLWPAPTIEKTLENGGAVNGVAVTHLATKNESPFAALGFPDPAKRTIQPVDTQTVIATFSKPVRQVLTTLSFQDAHCATAYWLVEVRFLRGERLEDYLIETTAPLFPRLRLPIGPHTFRIETRNPNEFTISDDFTIEVPAL